MSDDIGLRQADRVIRALSHDTSTGGTRFTSKATTGQLGGIELVPDLVYRYQQYDSEDDNAPVTLTVYLGLGAVGTALWEQETRALDRIGRLGHSALPVALGGGVLAPTPEWPGAAWVRTKSFRAVSAKAMASYYAQDRGKALSQLWLLADALSVVHGAQMSHRNLWPGTLAVDDNRVPGEAAGDRAPNQTLRLARFEMSAMLSNLLSSTRSRGLGSEDVRRYYQLEPQSWIYAPPERLDFIFGDDTAGIGDVKGDIFSLGMLAVEWLIESDLLEGPTDTRDDLRNLHGTIRSAVNFTRAIPSALRSIVYSMIDPEPSGRPTAWQASAAIGESYDTAASVFENTNRATRPYLISYLRKHADVNLERWGYVNGSTETPEGRAQITSLLENDMRGARVVRSESGAQRFMTYGDPKKFAESTTVIIGKELVWFASELLVETGMTGLEPIPEARVVRFVMQKNSDLVKELTEGALLREIFAVDVVDSKDGELAKEMAAQNRPDWNDLLDTTRLARELPADLMARVRAHEWYLEYQRATLAAREYAYRVESTNDGEGVTIRWDIDEDLEERGRREVGLSRVAVRDRARPAMVDFFGSASDDLEGIRIEVFAAENGRRKKRPIGSFYLGEVQGTEFLTLKVTGGVKIPERGWVRLAGDSGSEPALGNQARAVSELSRRPDLLRQLVTPSGGRIPVRSWAHAVDGLEGTGPDHVRSILEHQTMYALQGPPGTGKTELTARAVAGYLVNEPGARVLVSAQSHDALDNLAERILKRLKMSGRGGRTAEFIALRVASDRTGGRASAELQRWREDRVVITLQSEVRSRVKHWLEQHGPGRPDRAALLRSWLSELDGLSLDFRRRVRRGANLVFATTGAATESNLVNHGSEEPFDWVVVEEAGRAWPTELALPLVRGNRWTLIGDHAQIGPYGRDEVDRFILELREDPDKELAATYENRAQLVAAFSTFGTLMDVEVQDPPRAILSEQYRMTSTIAEVVSKTFYKGDLATPRPDQDHGFTTPHWTRGRSLVWIDTGDRQAARGYWSNEFEVEVVQEVLSSLHPLPTELNHSVAVLTPYRKQVEAFEGHLNGLSAKTIDSYQGLEADVVIASLVRDKTVDSELPARFHVGHLSHAGRTNVLLSRARKLMIIVGRFDVFKNHAGPWWADATRVIEEKGHIFTIDKDWRSR